MAEPTTRPTDTGAVRPDDPSAPDAGSVDAVDVGRRRFFRQFAGELANTAATMLGAAQALQQTSAEMAGAILDPTKAATSEGAARTAERTATGAEGEPVFRTSFRIERNQVRFVDQRALPGAVAEHPAGSAAEVSWAIRHDVVIGGPAIAQAAVVGLALTADKVRGSRPYARRATLRGAANALINSSPTHAALRGAVDRAIAAYAAVGELAEDGDAIAAAIHAAADEIIAEAAADHGRLVDAGLAILDDLVPSSAAAPESPPPPLRLIIHGPSGALAGGQFGTALAIAIAAHYAERDVHVVVPEGRPGFTGARIGCWELAAAGVPHTLVADAAAPALIAGGEVDAILVPADRIAASGDVAATIGTYGLALAAARRGVPFLVCAPASAFDPATPDEAGIVIASKPVNALQVVGGADIAPRGTDARIPAHDVTPADLVTGFITGEGLRQPPFAVAADPAATDDPAAPPSEPNA